MPPRGLATQERPLVDEGTVTVRNHGVVTIGNDIHKARAVVESLEEWAKIWTITKLFGGPKYVLDESKYIESK